MSRPRQDMQLPLIIVGAGGHGRVLIDALLLNGASILGIVDPALPTAMTGPNGLKILGGDEAIDGFGTEDILLVNGIGGTRTTAERGALYKRWRAKGFRFASVIHPSAVISPSAILADGVQVMAGCVVQTGASIGANSIINTRASIDHDCRIGETVHVAPGVTLSGSVTIGDGAHIGTGAVVIQGVSIGKDSLVAAGAVVYRDLPDRAQYIKSQRNEQNV